MEINFEISTALRACIGKIKFAKTPLSAWALKSFYFGAY